MAIANVTAIFKILALDHLNLNIKILWILCSSQYNRGDYSAKLTLLKEGEGGIKNMWFGKKIKIKGTERKN